MLKNERGEYVDVQGRPVAPDQVKVLLAMEGNLEANPHKNK